MDQKAFVESSVKPGVQILKIPADMVVDDVARAFDVMLEQASKGSIRPDQEFQFPVTFTYGDNKLKLTSIVSISVKQALLDKLTTHVAATDGTGFCQAGAGCQVQQRSTSQRGTFACCDSLSSATGCYECF